MVRIVNERRGGRKMIQGIWISECVSLREWFMFAIFYDLTRYLHDDVTAAAADVCIHYLDYPTN